MGGDNSTVTASRNCCREAAHVETETVDTVYQVSRKPTKEAAGEGSDTATFVNAAFAPRPEPWSS